MSLTLSSRRFFIEEKNFRKNKFVSLIFSVISSGFKKASVFSRFFSHRNQILSLSHVKATHVINRFMFCSRVSTKSIFNGKNDRHDSHRRKKKTLFEQMWTWAETQLNSIEKKTIEFFVQFSFDRRLGPMRRRRGIFFGISDITTMTRWFQSVVFVKRSSSLTDVHGSTTTFRSSRREHFNFGNFSSISSSRLSMIE